MDVDEPWAYRQPCGIDRPRGLIGYRADRDYPARSDRDVCGVARSSTPVDDGPALDEQVVQVRPRSCWVGQASGHFCPTAGVHFERAWAVGQRDLDVEGGAGERVEVGPEDHVGRALGPAALFQDRAAVRPVVR